MMLKLTQLWRNFLEQLLSNLSRILKMSFHRNLMNIWGLGLLFLVSFSLFAPLSANAQSSSSSSIQRMREMLLPVIEDSTDWSFKVGLGLVSASAFYALVVRASKLGD